ncbi:hypothetical protein [Sutcliffiella horikoshii]|uniref:hypothetical protein n=1 Tax=Sutcliffiella horikoshii TaxID=79883 RepID=UPI003CF651E3
MRLYLTKNKQGFIGLIVVIIMLFSFFVDSFVVAGFELEWSFFALPFIIFGLLSTKRKKKLPINSLYFFILFCVFLLLFAIIRYPFDQVFVGIAHFIRFLSLILTLIWLITCNTSEDIKEFYGKYRVVAFIILFLLLLGTFLKLDFLIFFDDYGRINTVNIQKNSLGYALVCFAIIFSEFENKKYVKKPVSWIIWAPICIFLVNRTGSYTASIFILLVVTLLILKLPNIKRQTKFFILLGLILSSLVLIIDYNLLANLLNTFGLSGINEFILSVKQNSLLNSTESVRFKTQLGVLDDFSIEMALGSYYYYYFSIHGYTAHNLYLQILYDTGIIGLFLFLFFCYKILMVSKHKFAILIILLYSLIEVFLMQYGSLIALGLLIRFSNNKMLNDKRGEV